MMSNDEEIAMRDVTHAGVVVSDRISRDVAARLDLEEALEASRYASHPYTTHPKEVLFFNSSILQFVFCYNFNLVYCNNIKFVCFLIYSSILV